MNKEINAQPNSKTWIVVEIKPIELCKIVIRKWVLHIKRDFNDKPILFKAN